VTEEVCQIRNSTGTVREFGGKPENSLVRGRSDRLVIALVIDYWTSHATSFYYVVPNELAAKLVRVYDQYGAPGDVYVMNRLYLIPSNDHCLMALQAAFDDELRRQSTGDIRIRDLYDIIMAWEEVDVECVDVAGVYGRFMLPVCTN
jgi:hypothetical protein